jgi:hypothetical protein
LAAVAFSVETTGFANTGTGQPLLALDAVGQDIVAALSNTNTLQEGELEALLPDNLAEILNPNLLELFRNANEFQVERPCGDGDGDGTVEEELCAQILESSTWRVLTGEVARLVFPVELCYSDQDTLLSVRQFPEEIFADGDGDVTTFAGPTGLPDLNPTGDHVLSLRLCLLSPMLFYTLQGHRPVVITDRGDYMPPLNAEQLNACPTTRTFEPTPAPGSMPSPTSPTAPNPTTPSDGSPTSAVTTKQYSLASTLVVACAWMLVL